MAVPGAGEAGAADLGVLLGRELSTAVVMFHEAVAARRGLSAAENKALDVLVRRGPMTSGDFARELGLTPGAVTGLVDRLSQAGYARRAADERDRRRMVVSADLDRINADMQPFFAPLRAAVDDLARPYPPEQLAAIRTFLGDLTRVLHGLTAEMTR